MHLAGSPAAPVNGLLLTVWSKTQQRANDAARGANHTITSNKTYELIRVRPRPRPLEQYLVPMIWVVCGSTSSWRERDSSIAVIVLASEGQALAFLPTLDSKASTANLVRRLVSVCTSARATLYPVIVLSMATFASVPGPPVAKEWPYWAVVESCVAATVTS